MKRNQKPLLRLSLPVKVMMLTGISYVIIWFVGRYLERWYGVDFSAELMGVSIGRWFWWLQALITAAVATFSSYVLFDRPVQRLKQAMKRVERGDFLARVPVSFRDELGDLVYRFNQMLLRITDLATDKVQSEHELTVSQEKLKYRHSLEEKSQLVEEANQRLEDAVRDLSLLYEIGQQVNSIIDLDHLYAQITKTLKAFLNIEEFALMVYDEEREELHVRAASGFVDDHAVLRTIFKKGEGISGLAAAMGRKIYIRDTSKEKRFLHYKGERLSRSSSFLSIPLVYKHETLGVINYGRQGVGSFSSGDVKMLSLVANQVALAIANAKLYTKTRELSVKDELTGIYNRRYFQQMLQMEWKRATRFRRDLSAVMIDVDHFKYYNDAYGHLHGDDVLRWLGQLLLKNLREVDTVARFGGEEFVLLLPDTDKQGAIAAAEKIRHIVEEQGKITISAGIATYPEDVAEVDDLIDHADIALYRAKEQGRNRIMCFAPPTASLVADEAEPPLAPRDEKPVKKKFITTLQ